METKKVEKESQETIPVLLHPQYTAWIYQQYKAWLRITKIGPGTIA